MPNSLPDSDPLVLRDEELFFRIVQTTHDITESVDLLRRAKVAVLREKAEAVARGDTSQDHQYAATVSRINDELHYQTRIQDEANIRMAVVALFGAEAWQDVLAYRRAALGIRETRASVPQPEQRRR